MIRKIIYCNGVGMSNHRLGKQSIEKLMISMCSQTTFSLIVYNLYCITDTFFLSRGIGSSANAAVGVFSPVIVLTGAFSTTIGVGAGSVLSRKLGEDDYQKAEKIVGCMFFIWIVCALAISACGLIFFDPLIKALGATDNILPYANIYGKIILAGTLMSTGFSGVMRANGDITYSTLQWLLPVLINLIFDPILIFVCGLGIAGAAYATLIAHFVTAVTSIYYFFIRKKTLCRIRPGLIRWDKQIAAEIMSIGFPSFFNSFGSSMIIVLFNNILKAIGGDTALSTYAILSRFNALVTTPFTGVMQGIQPIIGYNFGKRNNERVSKTVRYAFITTIVYGLAVTCVCLFGAANIYRFFTAQADIQVMGAEALRIISLSYGIKGLAGVTTAYFQAVGNARIVFKLSLGNVFFIQIPVILIMSLFNNSTVLWFSCIISDIVLSIWAIQTYRKRRNFVYV